jgi:PBSX family phage portal protein
MSDDEKIALNVEGIDGGTSTKSPDSQQLADLRVTARQGIGRKPPYDPDILSSFVEKNETHSVAVRKKARWEVGFGFDLVPVDSADDGDADELEEQLVNDFWFSRESNWQTGPDHSAEPTVPEEVLELARQDYHAVGWCALEILTDTMGRPVGLAHVPANTVRVRTPQSEYDSVRHPESGNYTDQSLGRYASRGYVQVRHGKRRYFGEAGDRYRGQEPLITEGDDGEVQVRYVEDEGAEERPIFVDSENGDVTFDDAGGLDNDPANELIFVRNPSVVPGSDEYGVPDWVSAIRTIVADEAAKDYNRDFFDNDTIPRLVIKVTGGELSEESKKDLKKMIRRNREEDHRTTLLEVEKFNESLSDDISIELEPLGQGITEEMSFAQFRTKNEHEVAKVHEVPPVLIGVTETSNRSNSEAQVHSFATEVVAPEQHKFAERLYRIIHQQALGVFDWTIDFVLRGGDLPQEDARVAREKIQAVQGAIPVNRALEMIGEDPLPEDHPVDGDTLLTNVDAGVGEGNANGESENARPSHLPPEKNCLGTMPYAQVEAQLQVENGVAQKDPIETAQFNSSNLDEAVFDLGTNDLFISFKRDDGPNSLYAYVDVPTSEWQGLVNAGSKGSYHHSNIRMSYGYLEVTNFHSRLPEGPLPESPPENIPAEI